MLDGDFKTLEQAGSGLLARLPAACQLVCASFEEEHLDRPGFGVNQPEFLHAVLLVEIALVELLCRERLGGVTDDERRRCVRLQLLPDEQRHHAVLE